MFSLSELRSHEGTMALFLHHRVSQGEVEIGQAHDPSVKETLCLADKAIISDLFQLS